MKEILEKVIQKYNELTQGNELQIHETSCVGGWNKLALVEHIVNRNNKGETISSEFKDTISILGESVTFKDDSYSIILQDIILNLLLDKYDKTRSS